jgi:hypothetical protein
MKSSIPNQATRTLSRIAAASIAVLLTTFVCLPATITWSGRTWNVTSGGMVAGNTGSAGNVVVDSNGYLHLKISKSGTAWTCAELFTTGNIGFGSYRWQVDGPVDKMDKNVVLGLFPYGPDIGLGADGTNEIDVEYSRWGNAAWPDGNYTVYPNSGATVGDTTFDFTLSGTLTTSSFVWNATSIAYRTQQGLKPMGDTSGTIKTWTYAPANPSVNIPQRAMPVGMNLWLCDGSGNAPSNGLPVEIVIHSFDYIPLDVSARIPLQTSRSRVSHCVLSADGSRLLLDKPINGYAALRILDAKGIVVRNGDLGNGAHDIRIAGLREGVYLVTIPQSNFFQRIVVTSFGLAQ